MSRKIRIKIIKETRSRVTIFLPTVNRKMHVPKKDFFERIDNDFYDVLNPEFLDEIMAKRD